MRPPPILDVVLALVLTACAQAEMWWYDGEPDGRAVVTASAAVIYTAVLGLRRSATLGSVSVMATILLVQALLGGRLTSTLSVALASMLVVFTVALELRRRPATLGAAAFLLAAWADLVVVEHDDAGVLSDLVFTGVFVVGAPFLAGRALRERRERTCELERVNAELAVQRDEVARLAALEERARIAREVHDVVAHSVSLMVVQAGAARHLLDQDVEQSREALTSVESVGREALAELRSTLGLLRDQPGGTPTTRSPQPDESQLADLVESVRAAGMEVTLDLDPSAVAGVRLSGGAGVAVYRIVQEALTNVLKHAGPARARVVARPDADGLCVVIEDDGRRGEVAHTSGHGVRGMRERAEVHGGRFEAGPLPGGGFRVSAWLPREGGR